MVVASPQRLPQVVDQLRLVTADTVDSCWRRLGVAESVIILFSRYGDARGPADACVVIRLGSHITSRHSLTAKCAIEIMGLANKPHVST